MTVMTVIIRIIGLVAIMQGDQKNQEAATTLLLLSPWPLPLRGTFTKHAS
jgi:hypothetical protein